MTDMQNRVKIARSFGSASESYDVSARLQRYTGKHLMSWLPNRNDLTVLDLGSGTGFFTDILNTSYQQVIGVDISTKMLSYAKANRSEEIRWIEADAFNLPLHNESIDFVYSNLVIQWCNPLSQALNDVMRVLKPGGLFAFTTLVDGTLHELKSSWKQVDDDQHVIDFLTEGDVRNVFGQSNCQLIEQNVKDIVLEYENVLHLAHELKGLGANHTPARKAKGLAGKDKWKRMTNAYHDFQEPNGVFPATYKVFSGLAVKLSS